MESERIQNPKAVEMELESMLEEQRSLAEKRRKHLFSLGYLLPLKHTKAEINEWYESLVDLNKRIDTHNVQSMMRIRLQYEKVCQECLEKLQECKQNLIDMKICSPKEAEKIVNPNFYQLIGKLQTQFEVKIEKMDDDLEHLVKNTETNCRHLYQYFQDALGIFDVHQQKLTQQENGLQKALNDCRGKHENMNKVRTLVLVWGGLREMNLDIVVDKLRMQSTDEKLKAYLERVYAALDIIRHGYTVFHQELLSKVMAYPGHVRHELLSYSATVSRYFYVLGSYKGKTLRKPGGSAEEGRDGGETEADLEISLEKESEEGLPLEEMGGADDVEEETEQEDGEEGEEMETSPPKDAVGGDDAERSEEGKALGPKTEDATEPALTKDLGKKPKRKDVIEEYFTTSGQNTYKVTEYLKKSKLRKPEKYYLGKLKSSSLPSYLEQVIRLQFFEQLEKWFDDTLSSSWVVVVAKKEELSSELQLRLHLHEPRRERIEKDVYNVRMVELRIHSDRLKRHCAGVIELLNKERSAFLKIREDHNAISRSFRNRILDMEKVFQMESRAEKLFADGGNFSPEELEGFMKQLQKENSRIEFVEGLIMIDMEKAETGYLEQATEIIGKFENRFRYLAMDRVFLEKIQRFLTNIQVKIKTEVAKSNWQTQTLNNSLEKLVQRIDACAHPNVDKEVERLYEFAKFVMEELKKRCKYLNCRLRMQEPEIISVPVVFAQDSLVSSAPSDISLPDGKVTVMGMEYTPVLNPSRMGKPAFDDASFHLIRNLTGFVRGRRMIDAQHEKDIAGQPGADRGGFQDQWLLKFVVSKQIRFPLEIQWARCILSFPWKLAKEFYKKDKHQITKPDCLQETYDLCIEALGQKMLGYLFQSDEYHIACISEFRVQLKTFEEELPRVVRLAIGKLLKDHEQLLAESTEQIRGHLQDQLKKWTAIKLHTSLGHPDNIPVLEALCQEEEKRQEEQVESILICTKRLEVCVTECAQKFVSTLATCTETILMELDNSLTIDDVQLGKTEKVREKTITLIRRKKAGLSLEVEERKLVAERGSRTWPGIPQTTIPSLPNQVIFQETASVTTAKTTLGHVAAVEERDAVYTKFKEKLEMEFARIKEENSSHLMKTQHWAHWWKKSVQKIKQLYL
ncbi:hypothetical protein Chor_002089 [Crotalus horridus]